MIRNDNIVDEIIKIFNEAKQKNYDELILKMDLDKYIDSIIRLPERDLDEAYEDGKRDADEERWEEGREDGYHEGFEDGKEYVLSKINSFYDKVKDEAEELLGSLE